MNKTDWTVLIVVLNFATVVFLVVTAALNLVAARTDIATVDIAAAILFATNAIILLRRILRQKN